MENDSNQFENGPERSWKNNPSREDYLKGQSLLGNTPEADKVFSEEELEAYDKLQHANYWQKLPPAKIRSEYNRVTSRVAELDRAMEERIQEIEEAQANPKTDIELITLSAQNKHWQGVREMINDNDRLRTIISTE